MKLVATGISRALAVRIGIVKGKRASNYRVILVLTGNNEKQMKNELGIEVCCENCTYNNPVNYRHCDACIDKGLVDFCPSYLILQSRIKELQEQQFTKEDLSYIFIALNYYMNALTKNPSNPVPLIINAEAYSRIDRLAKKVNLQRTTL